MASIYHGNHRRKGEFSEYNWTTQLAAHKTFIKSSSNKSSFNCENISQKLKKNSFKEILFLLIILILQLNDQKFLRKLLIKIPLNIVLVPALRRLLSKKRKEKRKILQVNSKELEKKIFLPFLFYKNSSTNFL